MKLKILLRKYIKISKTDFFLSNSFIIILLASSTLLKIILKFYFVLKLFKVRCTYSSPFKSFLLTKA